MDKILVCTKNKETTVCYAFTYSPSGTLDYDQKVDVPENLSEYQKFEINVKEPNSEKKLSEVDEASEKLKEIFGQSVF